MNHCLILQWKEPREVPRGLQCGSVSALPIDISPRPADSVSALKTNTDIVMLAVSHIYAKSLILILSM